MRNDSKSQKQKEEQFKLRFSGLAVSEKKKVYLQVLNDALGNVTLATKTCGIDRSLPYKWRSGDIEFYQKVEEVSEVTLDYVEGCLMRNIKTGKEASIIFYLKTRGKKRGYVERTEITGEDGDRIKTSVDLKDLSLSALKEIRKAMVEK